MGCSVSAAAVPHIPITDDQIKMADNDFLGTFGEACPLEKMLASSALLPVSSQSASPRGLHPMLFYPRVRIQCASPHGLHLFPGSYPVRFSHVGFCSHSLEVGKKRHRHIDNNRIYIRVQFCLRFALFKI